MSRYASAMPAAWVRERGGVLVTGADLGTSVLPILFGTRPEIWLLVVRPGTR